MHLLPGSPPPATTAHLTGDETIVFSPCIEIPFPSGNPLASRALSAFEFCFGAFIVIGHNVFHIVPNEVIVLSVLGLISIRLRDGNWSAMGLKDRHRGGGFF